MPTMVNPFPYLYINIIHHASFLFPLFRGFNIISQIHEKGFYRLYVKGGATIRSFLKEDLIDEIVLTTIPILLGGESSLFSELPKEPKFELIGTKTYLNQITQNHYKQKK